MLTAAHLSLKKSSLFPFLNRKLSENYFFLASITGQPLVFNDKKIIIKLQSLPQIPKLIPTEAHISIFKESSDLCHYTVILSDDKKDEIKAHIFFNAQLCCSHVEAYVVTDGGQKNPYELPALLIEKLKNEAAAQVLPWATRLENERVSVFTELNALYQQMSDQIAPLFDIAATPAEQESLDAQGLLKGLADHCEIMLHYFPSLKSSRQYCPHFYRTIADLITQPSPSKLSMLSHAQTCISNESHSKSKDASIAQQRAPEKPLNKYPRNNEVLSLLSIIEKQQSLLQHLEKICEVSEIGSLLQDFQRGHETVQSVMEECLSLEHQLSPTSQGVSKKLLARFLWSSNKFFQQQNQCYVRVFNAIVHSLRIQQVTAEDLRKYPELKSLAKNYGPPLIVEHIEELMGCFSHDPVALDVHISGIIEGAALWNIAHTEFFDTPLQRGARGSTTIISLKQLLIEQATLNPEASRSLGIALGTKALDVFSWVKDTSGSMSVLADKIFCLNSLPQFCRDKLLEVYGSSSSFFVHLKNSCNDYPRFLAHISRDDLHALRDQRLKIYTDLAARTDTFQEIAQGALLGMECSEGLLATDTTWFAEMKSLSGLLDYMEKISELEPEKKQSVTLQRFIESMLHAQANNQTIIKAPEIKRSDEKNFGYYLDHYMPTVGLAHDYLHKFEDYVSACDLFVRGFEVLCLNKSLDLNSLIPYFDVCGLAVFTCLSAVLDTPSLKYTEDRYQYGQHFHKTIIDTIMMYDESDSRHSRLLCEYKRAVDEEFQRRKKIFDLWGITCEHQREVLCYQELCKMMDDAHKNYSHRFPFDNHHQPTVDKLKLDIFEKTKPYLLDKEHAEATLILSQKEAQNGSKKKIKKSRQRKNKP